MTCSLQKREKDGEENGGGQKEDGSPKKDSTVDSSFVFGQNIKERAKVRMGFCVF